MKNLKKQNYPPDIPNRILQIANVQIKLINNRDYKQNQFDINSSNIESIILGEEQNINDLLKRKVIDFHIKDLVNLLKEREINHTSFKNFEQNIRNGLNNLDWFSVACSFLNDSLTGDNNKAKDAFNNYYLAKISKNVEENRQLLIKTMNSFVETIGKERFEELKLLVKTELQEIKEIKEKIDNSLNPQPSLIYDYSHQTQSENKAIFRRRYVPFVGRDAEMSQLRIFFESENLLEWQLVTSAGGSGKSRLAMEFCYKLAGHSKDYQLGFYRVNHKDKIDWHKWQPLNKTLIVIDYVATNYKTILEILSSIYLRVHNLKYPVRFLLLEREKNGEWWKNFEDYYRVENYIPNPFADAIDLPPLFNNLLEIIAFCLQKAKKNIPNTQQGWYEIFENLKKIDPLGRPLFAFYAGLALASGETIRNWKVEDLLENHLKREESHFWKNGNNNNDLLEKHKNLVALATMMGGMNYDVLGRLLEKNYGYLPSINEFDTNIYENLSDIKDEALRPLEPDILGEYFVHKQLQKEPNPLKNRNKTIELIDEAWQNAPLGMTFFVLRFYQDFFDFNIKEALLKLPLEANEETNYFYCSMFLELSGIMIKNSLIDEVEKFWEKIQTICSEIPSNRFLMLKAKTIYNLIFYFTNNNFFEKAENYYDRIATMARHDNHNPEVLKEVLIWKAKSLHHLSLEFGRANIVEKSERFYGKIVEMSLEKHSLEVLHEIIKIRAMSVYGLVFYLGNHKFLEISERYYFEIKEMSFENYPLDVLKEIMRNRVKSAFHYYKLKHFTSWQLSLNWLTEELLKSYEKLQIAEIAIIVEAAFIDFYKKYRNEIPNQTSEQIKSLLVELVRLHHKDVSWQPYMGLIINDFKEFGLLLNAPQE